MADPLEGFSGEPLTPFENKKMRKLLRDKERNEWFVSVVLVWSGYLGGAATAIYAVRDHIAKVFKALFA